MSLFFTRATIFLASCYNFCFQFLFIPFAIFVSTFRHCMQIRLKLNQFIYPCEVFMSVCESMRHLINIYFVCVFIFYRTFCHSDCCVYLCAFLTMYILYMCIHLSVCLPTHLPTDLSVYLPISSILLPIYLSARRSI